VILLDEIEKASPEIFDVLLGAFDEGRLTDPWGRPTYLRSAVIIMTSNLGATSGEPFGLSAGRGAAGGGSEPAYDLEAAGFFRPEFFNRIDSVLMFNPLSVETMRTIAEKELADVRRREGLVKAGLTLAWSPEVVALLAREGFDARYGARPLQRTIETMVVTPLARFLVERAGVRDVTIRLEVAGHRIVIAMG
jgi:ATP-dependent Clp protease ATP-binding subunit ClpC